MIENEAYWKNLSEIIAKRDETLKDVSLEDLKCAFEEIADEYFIATYVYSNRRKYKYMLFNYSLLRPEIHSRFQSELYDKWYNVYCVKRGAAAPEEVSPDEEESAAADVAVEDAPAEVKEERSVATEPPIKKAAVKPAPVRTSSPLNRNDWFDKITDFMAALIKLVYDPEY